MAGTVPIQLQPIPGLHYDPTLADLEASRDVYEYPIPFPRTSFLRATNILG